MLGKDKYCVGCGQRLGEGHRFCPNCGTSRPTRYVQASPAQVFTPEEILAKEPLPASPKPSPKAEEQVAEFRQGRSMGPVHETTHIPAPQAEVPPPPPPPQERPTSAQPGLAEPGVLGRLFATVVTGLLLFGLLSFLGLGPEAAGAVTLVLMALAAFDFERKRAKRLRLRIAPTHSRTIPQWVKIAVATRDGGTCRRCGSSADLQYDHIIPFSRGGSSTDVSNIQLLCGRCNRRKSNRYVG